MSNKISKSFLSIFLAFAIVLTSGIVGSFVYASNFTGPKTEGGFEKYYENGRLASNTVSYKDKTVYKTDDQGRIIGKASLNEGDEYITVKSQKGYMSAGDAFAGRNSRSTISARKNYIYKIVDQAINITSKKGVPGAWINPNDEKANIEKLFETVNLVDFDKIVLKSGEYTVGSSVKLLQSLRGYINAADSISGRNPRNTLNTGTYYVYKMVGEAINISTRQGSAGSWVKISDLNQATSSQKVVEKAPEKAPEKVIELKEGNSIKTENTIRGYMNAADSISGNNPRTTFRPGTYYIYKLAGNSVNISTRQGSAGAWVKASDLGQTKTPIESKPVETKPVETKPVETKPVNQNSNPDIQEGSSIVVVNTVRGYYNASDSIRGNNPRISFRPGTYYVYKIVTGSVNISASRGSAGAWVNINDLGATIKEEPPVKEEAPVVVEENIDIKETIPQTDSKFKIVVDPGHGEIDNRGGVLFNEGEQNYLFSQLFIKEALKYKDVEITTTRTRQSQNPSLTARAQAGVGADLFLSFHTNAAPVSSSYDYRNIRGTETFSSHDSKNYQLGTHISGMISRLLNTPNRGLKFTNYSGQVFTRPVPGSKDYYAVLRSPNTATDRFLIEFVFHTNLEDSRAYLNNQRELARDLMTTIANYYGLSK